MVIENKLLNYFDGDELATNVWQAKYKYKDEETPDKMHWRMAKRFASIEYNYIIQERQTLDSTKIQALSDYGRDNLLLDLEELPYEKLLKHLILKFYNLFKKFEKIIPQGSVMETLGTDKLNSLSNCYVIPEPKDSYPSIMKIEAEQIFLMKRRGGVGHGLSGLRPKGTKTNNAAKTSTGAVSFAPRYSNSTLEVSQGGRRGALMLTMDIRHPDILNFIKLKRDKTSVTGANISVKLNDEFMETVENDEDFILGFPIEYDFTKTINPSKIVYNKLKPVSYGDNFIDVGYVKKIKAKELWNELVHSATKYAEPGLMYLDNIHNYDPASVYEQYKSTNSNPCGEQYLENYSSCRLIAINYLSFIKNPFENNSEVDYDKVYSIVYEATRLGDDLVDLEIEYIDKIINKIKTDPEDEETKRDELNLWFKIRKAALTGRRQGVGLTALGDVLASLNLRYGSKEGNIVVDKIMSTKFRAELDANIDLAILRGTFEGWDINKEYDFEDDLDKDTQFAYGNNDWYKFVKENYKEQFIRMKKWGRRSINTSTIAPTGSVSILTRTSSGIEPLFAPFYKRRKKSVGDDIVVFTDKNGVKWSEFFVLHPQFEKWLQKNTKFGLTTGVKDLDEEQLNNLFKESPWYGSTANDIPWKERVDLQAILQKYTQNAISSTINLPESTTEKEVSDIYMYGWKKGLKGQTVYVEGSRDGVLVTKSKIDTSEAHKSRPKTLKAESFTTSIFGDKYSIFIGFREDGRPYELFACKGDTISEKGTITKEDSRVFSFKGNGEDSRKRIITTRMTEEQGALTRLISANLRHGRNIDYINKDLERETKTAGSFIAAINRILSKFAENKIKRGSICPNCGNDSLVYKEGCNTCQLCGWSACG